MSDICTFYWIRVHWGEVPRPERLLGDRLTVPWKSGWLPDALPRSASRAAVGTLRGICAHLGLHASAWLFCLQPRGAHAHAERLSLSLPPLYSSFSIPPSPFPSPFNLAS